MTTIMAAPWWWSRRLYVRQPLLTGEDVAKVQRMIGAQETGVYDEATAIRVRGWQTAKGLKVDGVVGVATAEAMTGKVAS